MTNSHAARGTHLWALLVLLAGGLAACDTADDTPPEQAASPGQAAPAEQEMPAEQAAPAERDASAQQDTSAEQKVTGLWEYTGLTTSDGQDLPLAGIFLFKDGTFLQQAVFSGEPFAEQGSMAHAGPYTAAADTVHLVAEQTISIAPEESEPLSFRASTEHDLDVSRSDEDLTLTFGSGTVQEFSYVGPGEGEVYALEDGAFALVDDWFILVQGNEDGAVTGYGTFEQADENLTLDVVRWAEATTSEASNHRDTTMQATFDGETLTLEDGRSFAVTR